LSFHKNVIASVAKQSIIAIKNGLLRRFAPRNDVCFAKLSVDIKISTPFKNAETQAELSLPGV
jgi:hypothetical protein